MPVAREAPVRVECTEDAQVPQTLRVSVNGSLDTVGTDKFMAELASRVIPNCPSLLVDLTNVEWVSSAGVGGLVRLLTRTQSSHSGFAIYGCNSRVRQVLRICGLEGPLNVRDDVDRARERVREMQAG